MSERTSWKQDGPSDYHRATHGSISQKLTNTLKNKINISFIIYWKFSRIKGHLMSLLDVFIFHMSIDIHVKKSGK